VGWCTVLPAVSLAVQTIYMIDELVCVFRDSSLSLLFRPCPAAARMRGRGAGSGDGGHGHNLRASSPSRSRRRLRRRVQIVLSSILSCAVEELLAPGLDRGFVSAGIALDDDPGGFCLFCDSLHGIEILRRPLDPRPRGTRPRVGVIANRIPVQQACFMVS